MSSTSVQDICVNLMFYYWVKFEAKKYLHFKGWYYMILYLLLKCNPTPRTIDIQYKHLHGDRQIGQIVKQKLEFFASKGFCTQCYLRNRPHAKSACFIINRYGNQSVFLNLVFPLKVKESLINSNYIYKQMPRGSRKKSPSLNGRAIKRKTFFRGFPR